MPIIMWNLRQTVISDAERDYLLAEGMIYDPSTPEDPLPGTYYPQDDVAIGVVLQHLRDYRQKNPALRVYTAEQLAKMAVYYVGVGQVTDPDVYEGTGAKLGDPEWQFSDGPVGKRGSSYDYLSLEEGLRALSPCIIIMEDN